MKLSGASLVFVAFGSVGCHVGPPPTEASGTTVEIHERIAAKMGPEVPFAGEAKVVEMLSKFRHSPSGKHFDQRLRLAHALVRVGRAADAVELYDELFAEAREAGLDGAELMDRVEFPRAVAY